MDEFYIPTQMADWQRCGQMSAWLVMSAMGSILLLLSTEYIIGTPWFPEMSINLENGNRFKITAKNSLRKQIHQFGEAK